MKMILQIPHGWNKGRIVGEACPTITTSAWEANNFLIEQVMEKKRGRANYNKMLSVLPNGNIRTHLDDAKKTGVSEGMFINPKNISPTIIAGNQIRIIDMAKKYRIRKLTPTECYRLMGVREDDIKVLRNCGVSESQQYKMAGNSIVVDVLMGIFKQMFEPEEKPEREQLNFPWWG